MKRAFTLIELLIASAVLGAVLVSIYAAFHTGMFGYKRIEESARIHQAARRVIERINLDIRNSFAYSEDKANFSGAANSVRFFTTVASYADGTLRNEYASVEYTQDENRLMRQCLKGRESVINNPSTVADEIADSVEAVTFKYFLFDETAKEFKEQDTWGQEGAAQDELEKMPAAVKITLTLKDKTTYVFERTIYLP